ncbi:hypothetical protein Vadar_026333 [Vaccinium darrowii]|uniref:Uncharacterized protein n=1 Tax=Vaccinium darrowii TaxID=229202 RepID=A0ACB7XK06_9ERIC|nr:hypothetical protein Vadar_026333 [Vaccinium darrowii]
MELDSNIAIGVAVVVAVMAWLGWILRLSLHLYISPLILTLVFQLANNNGVGQQYCNWCCSSCSCDGMVGVECVELGMVDTKETGEVPQETRSERELVQAFLYRPKRELQDDQRSPVPSH